MRTAAELLHMLTHCVRLLTAAQLADVHARRLADELSATGLLTRCVVRCGPLLPLRAPIASWQPGLPAPDFQKCSYRARIRGGGPDRPTTAFIASRRAAAICGGRGGPLRNPLQATHDVHVSQVLLILLKHAPDLATRWRGEDVMPWLPNRRSGGRTDAVILAADGRVERAIELVGASYGPRRLAAIHRHCSSRNWSYELW